MEHEVFVPVPAERLTAALADPAQVARAVPGLQQDVGTEPVAGRLKVRIGGHTITYRGAVRVSPREDGGYAVEGDATEARGSGSVKLALTLRLHDADGGATLRFTGTASADGRVTELPPEAVDSAVARLLNRFAGNLGAGTARSAEAGISGGGGATDDAVLGAEAAAEAAAEADADADADEAKAGETPDAPASADGLVSPDDLVDGDDGGEVGDAGDLDDVDEPAVHQDVEDVFDAEAPPSGLDDLTGPGEPPAEAAHARRTMIGRSAEEVDHAPPRGRYAPVPAPQTVVPNSTLRWAAPAAALVVASAIVVGRALRRRT
ncbi:SRPBCC domain-containing protein [Streptomyces sp. NPDC000658]|uniref:SRPBCC domain-containing protein n=1 Tax=Streptomyces sp. NPDC000658 TaxID=3154266 RepID=UPI0033226357